MKQNKVVNGGCAEPYDNIYYQTNTSAIIVVVVIADWSIEAERQ